MKRSLAHLQAAVLAAAAIGVGCVRTSSGVSQKGR
jgi:hypothetical protein